MRNFVVLIGGPCRFMACDRAHDQTWSNYIVPIQLAAKENLYKRATDEKIYWFVYVPPYEHRWADDFTITKKEKKQDDGHWLHSIRQKAAQKVLKRGGSSYINRIQMIAAANGVVYTSLQKPEDFWDNLSKFPKKSISRVWYFGHASNKGALFLALIHDNNCQPCALTQDSITLDQISAHSHLADQFDPNTKETSKFYGCYTSAFAKEWNKIFKVPAEGASRKIDFGAIDKPSTNPNVLERLQKTPTSEDIPDWSRY